MSTEISTGHVEVRFARFTARAEPRAHARDALPLRSERAPDGRCIDEVGKERAWHRLPRITRGRRRA